MAVSVVSGVVTRLSNLLLQEAIYLIDVSDKARELQTELTRIQCFLKDADERQNESAFVKNSIAEMKDLAYDAEDVIATYALTVASRKGRGIQKFLIRCACILDEGITVHQVGSKIDAIKTRISNLKQSFQEYGIIRESTMQVGGPSSLHEREREQRQTFSHLQHKVVGFDDKPELVDFLLQEEEGKRVVSICGMGGLGKTTLAKMVYNDPQVKRHFEHRAWACISQQYQRRLVWEDILFSLLFSLRSLDENEKDEIRWLKDDIRRLTDDEIVNKLRIVQMEHKCLLILDDMWDVETLNLLLEAFPEKDTKSKILLTSRNEKVHQRVDPGGFLYKLQPLNEAKSLELLEKIAISGREDPVAKIGSDFCSMASAVHIGLWTRIQEWARVRNPTCPVATTTRHKPLPAKTWMDKFGKEMIGYCGGLPLAITVLGGLLATKQTLGEWQDVLKHAKSYLHVEDSRVNNMLALSYNDLPFHLKPCFLYLGQFPEDFEIPTKELIRMWMGEGFISQIQHRGGREDTMDDVGDRYLRELVQRSMVLVGKKGSLGRFKTCRMHDLMRDFCISKAQDENFLHFTNTLSMKQREVQIGKVRRLAIISESGDNSIKGIKFNEYPYLRSLLYLLPLPLLGQNSKSYSDFKESCFKKFKLVRVLHLENFQKHNYKLPKDIGCLIHLRYLSLKGSNINKVPSSIGNLSCLETLDLRTFFYRSCKYENTSLLDSIHNPRVPNVFKYMKQLKHLYLPDGYRVCSKLELANLSYLQTLVNVQPKTIQIPTWFKLNRLRVLKVRNNRRAQDAIQILMSSCPHIEKLNLYFHIKKLPEAHRFPPNLAKLTLRLTFLKEDPMPTLEKLPNLKFLSLAYNSFVGKDTVCSEGGFPLLQCLVLWSLQELVQWKVEEGAMPNLCRLKILYCTELKTIPDGLTFVTTLQELEIKGMRKSLKDRLDEGGPDFDKVKHVPSRVFQKCDRE